VSLATQASLIVATLDLELVRLIRGAMRTADLASARGSRALLTPTDRFEPRKVLHPEPRFEPRRVIHPTPRFEPRPVERTAKTSPDCVPLCSAPCCPETSHITPSPIQPPWKVLPWENPPPPAQVIKVVIHRPDNECKGSIIDCFI
jgi:hypothetical protein